MNTKKKLKAQYNSFYDFEQIIHTFVQFFPDKNFVCWSVRCSNFSKSTLLKVFIITWYP